MTADMQPMVRVRGLSKNFGGADVLSDISFDFQRGQVHSIIGPNGAGKTTLLNVLTGLYTPSAGLVEVAGESTVGVPPHRLALRGVSRTFQNLKISFNMTVLENVLLGSHLHLRTGVIQGILRLPALRRGEVAAIDEARRLLAFAGVPADDGLMPSELSYGALKRLEIARALASKPQLILLDEPAAGLNPQETHEIKELVDKLGDASITVVLVEHDMKLVMGVSHNIVVINYGRKIAEGTPEQVSRDEEVIAAYLGVQRDENKAEAAV